MMPCRRLRSCCYSVFLLALAACASAPPVSNRIAIQTTSGGRLLPGASCSVTTDGGSWNLVTPASIAAPFGGDVRVVCDMPGYRRSEVIYRPPPVALSGSQVGIGIGGGSGGVGIGVGLGVPIGGGVAITYPPQLTVEMSVAR